MNSTATNELAFTERERVHPPKPPLGFHVGVIGHRPDPKKRPDPDVSAIRSTVRDILTLIADAFSGMAATRGDLFALRKRGDKGSPAGCRIVSSLAEGADQWVAEEALQLGYELQCPLPFSRDEYAKDFHGDALTAYQSLLSRATSVFEMDGAREANRSSESYQAAGRVVIQQCDILIAIWDGDEERGRGGTGQMVREALQEGVPVVWIRWATPPGEWRLLSEPNWRLVGRSEDLEGDGARLRELVGFILIPPDLCLEQPREAPNCLRATYYAEFQPKRSLLAGFWGAFQKLVTWNVPVWKIGIVPFDEATKRSWKDEGRKSQTWGNGANGDSHGVPDVEDLMTATDRHFFAHYGWANQLSILYAGRYRSAFLLNYLLGPLAVLLALLGIPSLARHHKEVWTIVAELIVIGFIIALTSRGRRLRWQERWIEYRTLAERLRLSRFLVLVGGWRQHVALPGHFRGYGDPANTWVHWHSRAVQRRFGLPHIQLDASRLEAIKFAFQNVLTSGQIEYHRGNSTRLHIIDDRLHRLGNGFFVATFLACAAHLGLALSRPNLPPGAWILFIALNALLPACGAAAAAIRNQGEFQRVARRSEGMRDELTCLQFSLGTIAARGDELNSQEMRRVVERIAHVMLNETLDWRIVFQDRPLVFPA